MASDVLTACCSLNPTVNTMSIYFVGVHRKSAISEKRHPCIENKRDSGSLLFVFTMSIIDICDRVVGINTFGSGYRNSKIIWLYTDHHNFLWYSLLQHKSIVSPIGLYNIFGVSIDKYKFVW